MTRAERPRAKYAVVAGRRQPGPRSRRQRDRDAPIGELALELQDELLDDRLHRLGRQRLERDDGVEPVAEFRAEHALDGGFRFAGRRARALIVAVATPS